MSLTFAFGVRAYGTGDGQMRLPFRHNGTGHQGRFATYAMPHLNKSTLLIEWRALLLSAGVHFDFDLIL